MSEVERIKEDLKRRIRVLHDPIQLIKVVDGKEVKVTAEEVKR